MPNCPVLTPIEVIRSCEIDGVVGDHPAVVQCAAIPVPSELGEDEILVAIITKPDVAVTAREIADWCRGSAPRR